MKDYQACLRQIKSLKDEIESKRKIPGISAALDIMNLRGQIKSLYWVIRKL